MQCTFRVTQKKRHGRMPLNCEHRAQQVWRNSALTRPLHHRPLRIKKTTTNGSLTFGPPPLPAQTNQSSSLCCIGAKSPPQLTGPPTQIKVAWRDCAHHRERLYDSAQ